MNPNPRTDQLIPTQFKPGQVGNPTGLRSAGRVLSEHFNYFSTSDLTEDELRKIAKDKSIGWTRRTAALRVLRSMESGDMADFETVLDGDKSLLELRGDGINTEIVKKIKKKRRKTTAPDGSEVEEIEREIELHDRSGVDFDRVSDRTEGKPKQVEELNVRREYIRTIRLERGETPGVGIEGGGGPAPRQLGPGSPDIRAGGDGQDAGVSS